MAGRWIKLCVDVWEAPETVHIAELTGVCIYGVVGRLCRIWTWFDRHTVNGRAGISTTFLDSLVEKPGFSQAMAEAGWLRLGEGWVALPNFIRHSGHEGKTRALRSRRMQRLRNADVARTAPPEKRREEERREEQRREEENTIREEENTNTPTLRESDWEGPVESF
jgi:hypothetical protein